MLFVLPFARTPPSLAYFLFYGSLGLVPISACLRLASDDRMALPFAWAWPVYFVLSTLAIFGPALAWHLVIIETRTEASCRYPFLTARTATRRTR